VVRRWCAPAPVPLVPELVLYQAVAALEHVWEQLGTLPYWAHPWPGGQVLARYLLDRPHLVRGRRVLDLGCGGGLLAVAAATAGAADVLAADVDPLALAAVRLNAEAVGVRIRVTAQDLLAGPHPGAAAERWDVVLVGDLWYTPDLAARATEFCRRAAADGALVLLGDPPRSYPGRGPTDRTGLQPLHRQDVPTPEGVEGTPVTQAVVWQVLPPT
jgi:predicted nicotinamide N-methyase